MGTTPTIRCPRPECGHPIDSHVGDVGRQAASGCHTVGPDPANPCECTMTPNLIAVAMLFGELTQAPAPQRVSRQPDGSWS